MVYKLYLYTKKMTSIFNLFIIIPIINILLLAINFILAPHKPYKEKKTPFECGYHSFLAQNRTQFTISFFLFGILFLLFDIEIVIIYPITVSSYFNAGYGILVVIIFVLILALGLVFELGKGALKIETKQSRLSLHSSLIFCVPYIIDAIPQGISSMCDFYTKAFKFSYVRKKLKKSVIFNLFIAIISFIFCSPYCLNCLDYGTFSRLLLCTLIVYYAFSIYIKSDQFNWFYNTTDLFLNLLLIMFFWTIIHLGADLVYIAYTMAFPGFAFDFLLKMDGNSGNSTSGGTGGGGPSGDDGPGGKPPKGKGPAKVIGFKKPYDSSEDEMGSDKDAVFKKPYLPVKDEIKPLATIENLKKNPVSYKTLGDLYLDQDVSKAVISDGSYNGPTAYFPAVATIKCIAKLSVENSDNEQSAMDTITGKFNAVLEKAETKEALIVSKIYNAREISIEDKQSLGERAHKNFLAEKAIFETIKKNTPVLIKQKFPDHTG